MVDVAAQDAVELALSEDQQPVQAFGPCSPHEAFGVRVRMRRADRRVDHLDRFAAEDLVGGGAELAVAVVDQEAHPLEQAGEAEVPRLLGDPGARRVGRAARQVDASAFKLDEEQDV
jgi:hypothetical protein